MELQKEKKKWGFIGKIGIVLFILIAVCCSSMFVRPIVDMEHYLQVWQNPVVVTAEVTKHAPYDDDGDTKYKSFITYIYDGTQYKNIFYEKRNAEDALTPVGTMVKVQISPKDPARQIAKIKSSGQMAPYVIFTVFLFIAGLYVGIQRWLHRQTSGIVDMEAIQRDIKREIYCRIGRPLLLLCWIGYGMLYWRYSVLVGSLPLAVAVVSCACWLYCMHTTIRDYRRVENKEFELRRDVLVDKKTVYDSEEDSYYLYYQSGERAWKSNVNAQEYARATIGDEVLAVYLPGKKGPIVHYNLRSKEES